MKCFWILTVFLTDVFPTSGWSTRQTVKPAGGTVTTPAIIYDSRLHKQHRISSTRHSYPQKRSEHLPRSSNQHSLWWPLAPILCFCGLAYARGLSARLLQLHSNIDTVVSDLSRHQRDCDAALVSEELSAALTPLGLQGFHDAVTGVRAWRTALARGRLPDFGPNGLDGPTPWPGQPVFGKCVQVFTDLRLPKFTARHPELTPLVLRALLQTIARFAAAPEGEGAAVPEEDPGAAAERRLAEFYAEWQPALEALGTLDDVFGLDHGLMGGGPQSFGVFDSIWQHDGWKPMAQVQARLQRMPQLRSLVRELGRRPSPTGQLHRGPPTRQHRVAPPGVAWATDAPQRVDSIAQSADLARLLPAELALLAARQRQQLEPLVASTLSQSSMGDASAVHASTLYRLFLARFAEKRLLTYQLTDWVDARSRAEPRRRFRPLLPRGPAGPIVVCLDTSQSMEGPREQIAKAVVLEAARSAHLQHRRCVVFAFSGKGNLQACHLDTDRPGLAALLAFLAHSFRGGTDVAAPLRQALAYLGTEQWAESDVLLVSDGELPVPPLGEDLMAALQAMRQDRGLQVHGLMVRPGASRAMDMICDHVHTFLAEFDPLASFPTRRGGGPARGLRAAPALGAALRPPTRAAGSWPGPRRSLALYSSMAHSEGYVEACDAPPRSYSALLQEAVESLQSGLVGREVEARLLLLAVLCREHLLLLGPPGTAKSALSRQLATLASGRYFERLLTRFTTPEELFGPLSLKALEQDVYRRVIDGYLPTTEFAFLDEIFKANSAILNALLTLLNERAFDDGAFRLPAPLLCTVGASNELPESEELEALYDRFLLRRQVSPVSDDDVLQLLNAHGVARSSSSDFEHPADLMALFRDPNLVPDAMAGVALPEHVGLLLRAARIHLRDTAQPSIYVSDRRLFQAQRMLRVAAWVQGRRVVTLPDCLLLQHVLWRQPEDAPALREWLWGALVPDGGVPQFRLVVRLVRDRAAEALAADTKGTRSWSAGVLEDLRLVKQNLAAAQAAAQQHAADLAGADGHAFLTREEAVAMRQSLAPQAQAVVADLEQLLAEVGELEATLQQAAQLGTSELLGRLQGAEEAGKGQGLTAEQLELGWSTEEAKARLSPRQFKRWKGARRRAERWVRGRDDGSWE